MILIYASFVVHIKPSGGIVHLDQFVGSGIMLIDEEDLKWIKPEDLVQLYESMNPAIRTYMEKYAPMMAAELEEKGRRPLLINVKKLKEELIRRGRWKNTSVRNVEQEQ